MSEAMWGYLFLFLGIMAAALLIFFGFVNTKSEHDYYIVKEVTQNAMLDSVDKMAYQKGLTQKEVDNIETIDCVSGKPGTIRIITERFVENFARRYAEIAKTNTDYRIEFYEIQECPAKVSLRVISKENYSFLRRLFRGEQSGNEDKEIVTELSSILETKD